MTNDKLKMTNYGINYYINIAKRYIHLTFIIGHLTLLIAALAIPANASSIVDLSEIGVGARPLGMGKAFNSIADDGSAIFTNPAGLANIKKLSFISMSGNLVGEVPYSVLGAACKARFGTIGLGYIGTSVSGISEMVLVGSTPEATGAAAKFTNYTLVLSYANEVRNLAVINRIKFLTDRQAKVGINLKYINYGFTGAASFEGAEGSGYDLDFGTIIPINRQLTTSFTIKNLIPGNNVEEDELPMSIIGGIAYKIPRRRLTTSADLEFTNRGSLLHLGAEWNPVPVLFIRLGLDQKPDGYNHAYGVGLNFKGIRFDYAYHTYAELDEFSSHFFSIGFSGK